MAGHFMVVAGETSGDLLAAELVRSLVAESARAGLPPPVFTGAGGPKMAAAGVDLVLDLVEHSVIGLWEVVRNYGKFRRLFEQLLEFALDKKPDVIVCVDFSGFNRRLARAIRQRTAEMADAGKNWKPLIVQYVSPQVWASRPGRARAMAKDFDLLLSIFPFEKGWYEKNAPEMRVEFVGHPIFDRYPRPSAGAPRQNPPLLLMLPGSRVGELRRHLPPMLGAWRSIQKARPDCQAAMVLPNEPLAALARNLGVDESIQIQVGGLPEMLRQTTVALACTGTITIECAYFEVPTVTLYKTSWATFEIARRIVTVKYLAMPNLLADEVIYPELIQNRATARNLEKPVLDLLNNEQERDGLRARLSTVIDSLGGPGAANRAAQAILKLLTERG